MYFVRPLFGADRITVQGVDDRVAARLVMCVAGRQEHKDIAIDRVPLKDRLPALLRELLCALRLRALHPGREAAERQFAPGE